MNKVLFYLGLMTTLLFLAFWSKPASESVFNYSKYLKTVQTAITVKKLKISKIDGSFYYA